jgi:hypothetical protein
MTQTPFDEIFNRVRITTRKIDIQSEFEMIDSNVNVLGVMLSKIWTKEPKITDSPNDKNMKTDMTSVFRSQGVGKTALKIEADFEVSADEKKDLADFILCLTDYSFEIAKRHIKDIALKDKDGGDFVMPENWYTKGLIEEDLSKKGLLY